MDLKLFLSVKIHELTCHTYRACRPFLLSQNPLLLRTRGLLALPFAILAGWSFSAGGVFPLLPSTIHSLDLGVLCVLFWVSFLGGVRTDLRLLKNFSLYKRWGATGLILIVLTALIFYSLLYWLPIDRIAFTLRDSLSVKDSPLRVLILALWSGVLFAGSSLVSSLPRLRERPGSPHLDNLIVVVGSAFCSTFLYSGKVVWANILSLLILGIMGLFLFQLLLPRNEKLSTPQRLKLGGVLILLTGLAQGLNLNVVVAGFLGGTISTHFLSKQIQQDSRIRSTEVPFRIFLAFVIGLTFEFQMQFFVLGLLLSAIRYLLKYILQKRTFYDLEAWRFSGFALLVLLANSLQAHSHFDQTLLMNIAVAGLLGTDCLRLLENMVFEKNKIKEGDFGNEV